MEQNNKPYVVYDLVTAGWLMYIHKRKLIKLREDRKDNTKYVYIFNNDDNKIKELINEYVNQKHSDK